MLTLLIIIPLAFSAFIHLSNPTGFPAVEQDEGHYMRRAMQILHGFGPQESKSTFFYAYDHPYFGQIFLAAVLSLINYPDSLNPSVNTHSIELLFLVPRIIMGIMAVADTFLVYKIAEIWYNRKIAFVSSILFAVMPSTWFSSRILLDSIELPFILLSILFAIYYTKKSDTNYVNNNSHNKKIILISLSGIFLGLAIFTKVPVFTMIPLIVFIILKRQNTNNRKSENLKALGIWFIPVVLIPMIWPAYAISTGQLYEWLDGVIWQSTRADRSFAEELKSVFLRMDPVLLLLGSLGLIYSVMRRNYFIALWTFPYLVFLYFVNWVYFYHLIPVLPSLCIASTIFFTDMIKKIQRQAIRRSLEVMFFGAIIIFGFVNSTILIDQKVNAFTFELAKLVTQSLPSNKGGASDVSEKVTLIGPNGEFSFYWIPYQIFNRNIDFKWFEARRDYINGPINSDKYLMVIDKEMRYLFSTDSTKQHIKYIGQLYNKSRLVDTLIYNSSIPNLSKYPYTNLIDDAYRGILNRRGIDWSDRIEIRTNY